MIDDLWLQVNSLNAQRNFGLWYEETETASDEYKQARLEYDAAREKFENITRAEIKRLVQ